jgi:transposase
MRRPRRNHSAKFKSKVALAALKGDKTMVELSEQFDVHVNQITEWKNQLLKQAENVFLTQAERRASESGPSVKDLQAKIGQLTMENDFSYGLSCQLGQTTPSRRGRRGSVERQGLHEERGVSLYCRRWIKLIFADWLPAVHLSVVGAASVLGRRSTAVAH